MEIKDKVLAGVAAAGVLGVIGTGIIGSGGKELPIEKPIPPIVEPAIQRQSAIRLENVDAAGVFVIRESKIATDAVKAVAVAKAQEQLKIGQQLEPSITNIPPREIRLGMMPHSLIAREQAKEREEKR